MQTIRYNTPTVYQDMETTEHILIGGTTGSGKSVALDGFIIHLLQHTPAEVGFVLIDPKRVELAKYKKFPHTLAHAWEMEEINNWLINCESEMNYRYAEMEKKDINKYDGGHIYIIIDEYAAIGGQYGKASKRAIEALTNIAFMGRAANMHIVACTQRPTADVIDGMLKANFTTTLALRTRSEQESRNLIQTKHARYLPRYGKAYYSTPNDTEIRCVDIKMVPDSLRADVTNYWTK